MATKAPSLKPIKLNGMPFDPNPLPLAILRLKKTLDQLPSDEVFTNDVIAQRSGLSLRAMQHETGTWRERDLYSYKRSSIRYWGNKAAIAELRRQVGGEA